MLLRARCDEKGSKGFAVFVKVTYDMKTSANVELHCKLANLP